MQEDEVAFVGFLHGVRVPHELAEASLYTLGVDVSTADELANLH